MKTYLTEADSANSVEKTCTGFRRPFKLLQDFTFFRSSNMSSKVSASSPLKTSRQKKVESIPQKEFQSKTRLTSLTSRQTTASRNSSNLRSSCRSPVSHKKQGQSDGKSKTSESSDGSVTSVGSLTSSPKWSHIKNKFENGESELSSRASKTTLLSNEPRKSLQSSKISRNTPSSNLENNSFLHKNKYLSSRKEVDKKNDTSANRSENTLSSNKTITEKTKLGSCNSRIETHKLKTRCASPKNSHLNIPAANTSALHSSNTSKKVSSSSVFKKSQSSSPEGSVKSSRCSSPNTASSSPTPKSCSPKTSLSSIPIDKSVNNSLKTSDSSNDCSNNVTRNIQSTNNSNLNSSYLSKRNFQESKMNSSYRGKQKHEDKPILSFNQLSQQSDKPKAFDSKTTKKSLGSDSEKLPSNIVNSLSSKVTNIVSNSATSTTNNKTNILENVEKIKDLTKQSQAVPKTVWIKDSAGNWIKKADTEAKTICSSKVASLRSKFMESGKECNTPLTKSSTTPNVPSKQIRNNRPLAKSSTTSSICDKVFLDDLSKKVTTIKDVANKKVICTNGEVSKNSLPCSEHESQDNNLQLNIVQRAILSYEGNLALLSPESQRRLKLVSEKVQAQTDDDKILRAKVKSNSQSNSKSCPDRNSPDATVKYSNNLPKKSNAQNSAGEPALPVRNFLNRYQKNKVSASKELNKPSADDNKPKSFTKTDSRSAFFTDISPATQNKNEKKEPVISDSNTTSKKTDSFTNNSKSVTKLTMNFKLPNGQTDVKSRVQENSSILQPNSSFLWRHSERAPSEYSKGSTTSSVSLTSSDYRNYYDIENYYSSLELEIDKGSENSEEHIYIDSQESNTSSDNYATSTYSAYQNIPKAKLQNGSHDDWTDMSDDDFRKSNVSSNQNNTLKKRRNKRHSSHRESSPSFTKSQNEQRKQVMNDTISFTDSSDTLINNEIGNESACDLSDVNHLYEPVYESLGNYLRNQDDGNCSISLSPDEPENGDFMNCSLTSLESAESAQQDKDENLRTSKTMEEKNSENKKGGNKISQLKRHLSWTKNDIRLELSSKFNKIKIKKNGRNSTEIGLKMQDSENVNTSPKKKTFIKCILRQKSASSIPLKRSPSPKKESALFYVHLTMGREKQRPFSDSVVNVETSKYSGDKLQNTRKQSDSALTFTTAVKCNQQVPRSRKFASGHTIQRPKTPPPLPPVQAVVNNRTPPNSGSLEKQRKTSTSTLICENDNVDSEFYTVLDPEYISTADPKQLHPYENEVLRLIHADGKSRSSNSTSVELPLDESDAPSDRGSKSNSMKFLSDLNLPLLHGFQTENLKSPFEEEPMYQFYQKDVQQRATLWYSIDGSESEFEDDICSKLSDPDYQSPKRPVLQSQMSAMDLVHGEGGQRRLWCEVPEVVNSGILKTITPNDRKIQEAMFEVITSEASYLKSLNFLTEHFVQCTEFSGDYTEKHVLDKRERHILFSDIQPVRDVSASLLTDLEKRWLKDIVLRDICDILYHHASKYFSVYVKYCSNQLYQERLLRELKEKRPEFMTVLKRLESNAVCQGLDMHSFLMLPMQRITRLPLLIDAIFKRLSVDSSIYQSCKIALATVNKIVAECNEGACKMQRMEEMLVISQQIDFKACKGLGLLSASRWLVKKGELVQLLMDNANRRAFGRSSRWCKIQLYLFLFTDLLVVTRKKSDDSYSVVDYCPRNMLQVMPADENTPPLPLRLPSSYRNVFQLIMLNNRDGKTVEMLLSCLLESDRTRWMSAVRPAKSENPDEKIYEEWDCPQVQCTHAYNAEQPDELSLEEADVVNVFKKMSDGWFEGERIRDGIRGWFPSSHAVEIINSHVRARNLHQRYRLLMLSQTYLEEHYKVQAQQSKK